MQGSRSIAIGMDQFQSRFPDIPIAGLRIRFGIADGFFVRRFAADRNLIQSPIATDLKADIKSFGLDIKLVMSGQGIWRRDAIVGANENRKQRGKAQ